MQSFGKLPDGREARLFTLQHPSDFAGAIVRLRVPDCRGSLADIALGYDKVAP